MDLNRCPSWPWPGGSAGRSVVLCTSRRRLWPQSGRVWRGASDVSLSHACSSLSARPPLSKISKKARNPRVRTTECTQADLCPPLLRSTLQQGPVGSSPFAPLQADSKAATSAAQTPGQPAGVHPRGAAGPVPTALGSAARPVRSRPRLPSLRSSFSLFR